MDTSVIDNLSCKILNRLKNKREVRDEQISFFLEWILNAIETYELVEMPRSFYLLKENVYKCWMYDNIDELEPNLAFIYGNIWSAIKMIELVENRKKEEVSLEVMANQYINNIKIFRVLKANPGINHKKLAEKSERTPSEISQFFNKLGEEKFFSFVRLGREKYYYLEDRGIDLLNEMEKRYKLDEIDKKSNVDRTSIDYNIVLKDNIEPNRYENYNKMKSEYITELQEKINRTLDDFRGITTYKDVNSEYISIKHYYKFDGQFTPVFEGNLKKIDCNRNKFDFSGKDKNSEKVLSL